MRTPAHRILSLIAATSFAAFSSIVFAQNAAQPAPARETPRPQDIDPAVNTSATPPARETPRPQDLDPAVDTSAPANAPKPAAAGATQRSGAAPGASAQPAPPADAAPGTAAQPGQPARTTGKGRSLDRLELDTTQITGNRELPKVLYIVPWKRSDLGDLVGKPVNSLLDEVLAPVDRDVFKRENRYYRALTPGADEGAGMPLGEKQIRPVPTSSETPAAGSVGSSAKPVTGSGTVAPPSGNER